jgi:hypothetical protein
MTNDINRTTNAEASAPPWICISAEHMMMSVNAYDSTLHARACYAVPKRKLASDGSIIPGELSCGDV